MPDRNPPLEKLFDYCLVEVEGKEGFGTGCFVAPGYVITCAHVLKGSESDEIVTIHWDTSSYQAIIQDKILGKENKALNMHYPDIALLQLQEPYPEHPCVYLDNSPKVDPEKTELFYSRGYTDFGGDPFRLTYIGRIRPGDEVLKFKEDQIIGGMSGAPILYLSNGKICGILNYSRDKKQELGGCAIPMDVVLLHFGDSLEALHKQYHRKYLYWTYMLPSYRPRSPINKAIRKIVTSSKPIIIAYGSSDFDNIVEKVDRYYQHHPLKSEMLYLPVDLELVSSTKDDIVNGILYAIVSQLLKAVPKLGNLSEERERLKKIKSRLTSPLPLCYRSFPDFMEDELCPSLRKMWEDGKSMFLINLQKFDRVCSDNKVGAIIRERIFDYLENESIRFLIQSCEADKLELYHSSNKLEDDEAAQNRIEYVPLTWKSEATSPDENQRSTYTLAMLYSGDVQDEIIRAKILRRTIQERRQDLVGWSIVEHCSPDLPATETLRNLLVRQESIKVTLVLFGSHSDARRVDLEMRYIRSYCEPFLKRAIPFIPVVLPSGRIPNHEELEEFPFDDPDLHKVYLDWSDEKGSFAELSIDALITAINEVQQKNLMWGDA